jgi:hypothetical protein
MRKTRTHFPTFGSYSLPSGLEDTVAGIPSPFPKPNPMYMVFRLEEQLNSQMTKTDKWSAKKPLHWFTPGLQYFGSEDNLVTYRFLSMVSEGGQPTALHRPARKKVEAAFDRKDLPIRSFLRGEDKRLNMSPQGLFRCCAISQQQWLQIARLLQYKLTDSLNRDAPLSRPLSCARNADHWMMRPIEQAAPTATPPKQRLSLWHYAY